jgi:hypothetical protein
MKKSFDCVTMKHQAWERIREELANLSREEELAYWQRVVEQDRLRRESKRLAREKEASLPRGD